MKAQTKITVRYAETDRMGAAYYANYLIWFEVGRTFFLKEIGISYKEMEDKFDCILPVTEAYCKYRKSALFDDTLVVETRIKDLTKRSISFEYKIYRDKDLLAEGYTKHININHSGKVRSFPEEIFHKLKKARDENG